MSDAIRKICCRLTSAWKMRLRCLHLFVALLVFAPFPLASSVLLGVYVINVLVIGWHILAWFITPASSEKVFPSGICAAFGLQLRRWTETALASWWLSGCSTWSVPGAASSSALTITPVVETLGGLAGPWNWRNPQIHPEDEKCAASNHCDWNFRRS